MAIHRIQVAGPASYFSPTFNGRFLEDLYHQDRPAVEGNIKYAMLLRLGIDI